MAFDYGTIPHPIREDIVAAQRAAWQRISGPGAAWTGEQRLAVARCVRHERARRHEPPWLRREGGAVEPSLPPTAVDAAAVIAVAAHRIDREWAKEKIQALGDVGYVELTGVAVSVTAIDAFAEALGAPLEPLPDAAPGEPDGSRPDALGDVGAHVAMTVPYAGPNVGRALSMAPGEQAMFMGLVGAMYSLRDFVEMVWKDRPLSRPQVELVAARVSAINECFY
jgi:hypothetical protein